MDITEKRMIIRGNTFLKPAHRSLLIFPLFHRVKGSEAKVIRDVCRQARLDMYVLAV